MSGLLRIDYGPVSLSIRTIGHLVDTGRIGVKFTIDLYQENSGTSVTEWTDLCYMSKENLRVGGIECPASRSIGWP